MADKLTDFDQLRKLAKEIDPGLSLAFYNEGNIEVRFYDRRLPRLSTHPEWNLLATLRSIEAVRPFLIGVQTGKEMLR